MVMIDSLKADPDFQERIIKRTFEENSNIKDFSDFSDALFNAFDTERGKRASKWFNSDELKFLFETNECKDRIRNNISDEEFRRIYGEIRKREVEVQRELSKGKIIKPKQIKIIYISKKIPIKTHIRAGKSIRAYSKGYTKWTPLEIRFLKIKKVRKKQTSRQIIIEYNKHFKENIRSSSSIKTKIYRL